MNKTQQKFVEELLNQMPQLNSERYQSYRSELEIKLARARREEQSTRWLVLGFVGLLIVIYAGVMIYSRTLNGSPEKALPDWLIYFIAEMVLLLPVCALLLAAIYLFKYRRRFKQTEKASNEAALGELQRQLNELRAQLAGAKNGPQTPSAP
jgi:uncharacterized membrane protein YcjF (UPF0283 family)